MTVSVTGNYDSLLFVDGDGTVYSKYVLLYPFYFFAYNTPTDYQQTRPCAALAQ
jgi:hypothetical protein